MKKTLKSLLTHLLAPLANRLGFWLTSAPESGSIDKQELLTIFYQNLKAINFRPRHIVDVGANHGTWTREALKHFPDSFYSLLEPQAWMRSDLEDILDVNSRVKFYAVGAGEIEGNFFFTLVDRDDSCNFQLSSQQARDKGYSQIEVPVVTLNRLLLETGLPAPDIIKIDAEGLDLAVLKGASNYFGVTEIFMVEAGVVNKNFDNSVLSVITFMDEKGYRLFEITDINRPFTPRILWLVELVFVKKNGLIDSQVYVEL